MIKFWFCYGTAHKFESVETYLLEDQQHKGFYENLQSMINILKASGNSYTFIQEKVSDFPSYHIFLEVEDMDAVLLKLAHPKLSTCYFDADQSERWWSQPL